MQKGFAPILLLITLVVLATVGGGVYYLSKSQISKSASQIVISPTPQPTSTPTSISDETANWKTYGSEDYSISYPSDWSIEKSAYTDDIRIQDRKKTSKINFIGCQDPSYYALGEGDLEIVSDNLQLRLGNRDYTAKEYMFNGNSRVIDFRLETAKVCRIMISQLIEQDPSWEETRDIVFKILSTFKFLDEDSQSYTCPKNGWVNCMPILTEEGEKACTREAVNWYRVNCPNFQGVAE